MKTSYLSVILLVFIVGCSKKCKECKFTGDIPDANSFELYYNLSSDSLQTFQFQACDKLFYSTVGSFDGHTIEDGQKFQLNGIKNMTALLLMSNPEFENKRLVIEKVVVEHNITQNNILFKYQIDVKSGQNGPSDPVFVNEEGKPAFPLILKNNVGLDFAASTTHQVMAISCFGQEGFTGGPYECNGRGMF